MFIASYLGSQIIFQNFNTLCGHMIKNLLTELVRVVSVRTYAPNFELNNFIPVQPSSPNIKYPVLLDNFIFCLFDNTQEIPDLIMTLFYRECGS